MSIHAIGVDIAEVDRIREMIEQNGDRFLKRVFTPWEIEYCSKKMDVQSFAARFAAKEAVFKAAGTGLREGITWRDVEVLNDNQGKPSVHLSGKIAELLTGTHIHLSLSHSKNYAVAMVVVEKNKELEFGN